MGTLYVVGAPVGNLDDVTLRAVRILGEVSLIAASIPRRARRLLARYGVTTPLAVLEPGPQAAIAPILTALEVSDVALLFDGHWPGPIGPGHELVRAALERGFPVTPVPGPTLPVTTLVLSGLPADSFVFLGEMPPHPAARQTLLAAVADERRTLVALAAPGRLATTLAELHRALGDRPLAAATASIQQSGEMWRGAIGEALEHLGTFAPQDEWVLVIGGAPEQAHRWGEDRLRAEVQARLAQGLGAKEVSRQLAAESGWPRRTIYRLASYEQDGTHV